MYDMDYLYAGLYYAFGTGSFNDFLSATTATNVAERIPLTKILDTKFLKEEVEIFPQEKKWPKEMALDLEQNDMLMSAKSGLSSRKRKMCSTP